LGEKQKSDIVAVLKIIFAIIASAAALFGFYHGLNLYIDARIQAKISNPAFLRELAMSVSPSVIFDEKETIVADSGAMAYLEKIAVSKGEKGELQITIKPIKYIGIEPILEPLDSRYAIKAERGHGYDWIFQLNSMNVVTWHSPKERRVERFRLEIIQ